jgi:putative lipoic acid-binding regulatory protein
MSNQSALEFPCDFPIKMMGRDTASFRQVARTLVEYHVGPVGDAAVKESLSRNGTFVSVTVTITASSQRQLDDIYRAASAHDDVLMAL